MDLLTDHRPDFIDDLTPSGREPNSPTVSRARRGLVVREGWNFMTPRGLDVFVITYPP